MRKPSRIAAWLGLAPVFLFTAAGCNRGPSSGQPGTSSAAKQSAVKAPPPAPASPLKLQVDEAFVRAKLDIYVGGGSNIDPPDPVGGGDGIPLISLSNNGPAFMAGELSASDGKTRFLKVTFDVTNPTAAPQSFRIGDLKMTDSSGTQWNWAAVGYGDKLCGMSGADRDAVAQTSVQLAPHASRQMSMAFPVTSSGTQGLELALGSSPRIAVKPSPADE